MNKRKAILEKAVELFADKGYNQTSMQQIADAVGISKGSLYSFFASKEDLIISIYEHYQQVVFERAFVAGLDESLTPKERLAKQFEVQFEGILEYKPYMKMHARGDSATDSEKISAMEHRMRGRFFSWLEGSLKDIYGDRIALYKWDLMFMIQSIYGTYMMLMVSGHAPVEPEKTGGHIVRMLSIMAEDYLDGKNAPLLHEEMMAGFKVAIDREGAFVSFEKREQAWKALYEKLNALEGEKHTFYIKTAEKIAEQIRTSPTDELILKGLFALLKQEETLENEAKALESEIW